MFEHYKAIGDVLDTRWAAGMTRCYDDAGDSVRKTYTAIVEECPETGVYVAHDPGFPGAHNKAKHLCDNS